jgi:hypothetical protein
MTVKWDIKSDLSIASTSPSTGCFAGTESPIHVQTCLVMVCLNQCPSCPIWKSDTSEDVFSLSLYVPLMASSGAAKIPNLWFVPLQIGSSSRRASQGR